MENRRSSRIDEGNMDKFAVEVKVMSDQELKTMFNKIINVYDLKQISSDTREELRQMLLLIDGEINAHKAGKSAAPARARNNLKEMRTMREIVQKLFENRRNRAMAGYINESLVNWGRSFVPKSKLNWYANGNLEIYVGKGRPLSIKVLANDDGTIDLQIGMTKQSATSRDNSYIDKVKAALKDLEVFVKRELGGLTGIPRGAFESFYKDNMKDLDDLVNSRIGI